jgi:mono/diheme cytochrome c family protein
VFVSHIPARRPCAAIFGAALAACGSPPAEREWTPEDHGQPSRGAMQSDAREAPDEGRENADPTARAAEALWNVTCAGCHGRQGRGDGAARPPGAAMPDLASPAWQDARSDEAIAVAIRDGRGMMPGFASQMHAEAIRVLVAHVRSLRKDAP